MGGAQQCTLCTSIWRNCPAINYTINLLWLLQREDSWLDFAFVFLLNSYGLINDIPTSLKGNDTESQHSDISRNSRTEEHFHPFRITQPCSCIETISEVKVKVSKNSDSDSDWFFFFLL